MTWTRPAIGFSNPDGKNPVVTIGGSVVAELREGDQGRVADLLVTVHRATLARVVPDRDHLVRISPGETVHLSEWMLRPNGSISLGDRLAVNAVEGGGILVRTQPYIHRPLS